MTVYLHVLPGLNYDHMLTMAGEYIWYVFWMPIYNYTTPAYIHMYMC